MIVYAKDAVPGVYYHRIINGAVQATWVVAMDQDKESPNDPDTWAEYSWPKTRTSNPLEAPPTELLIMADQDDA